MTISTQDSSGSGYISYRAEVRRRRVPGSGKSLARTLDTREHDICKRVVEQAAAALKMARDSDESFWAILRSAFDELVLSAHIQNRYGIEMSIPNILHALHDLSEQTYENKALTFGFLVRDVKVPKASRDFPYPFLESKRFKALSDGYRTAYVVTSTGSVIDFVDLKTSTRKKLSADNYYPEWAEPIARGSRNALFAVALSRQGDILVFENGSLLFSYRYGQWQYWNHNYLIALLTNLARAQSVPRKFVGTLVRAIYKAALDLSFRRSGGLFVLLKNRYNLDELVPSGDAVGESVHSESTPSFDAIVEGRGFHHMPRSVVVELASIDGAIVLNNNGEIRAYGSILQPNKIGKLRGTEGSRTRAAVGASHYGVAVKISSDGDITAYQKGKSFIRI